MEFDLKDMQALLMATEVALAVKKIVKEEDLPPTEVFDAIQVVHDKLYTVLSRPEEE